MTTKWQELSWAENIQICQQGEAQEDSLLHTYVTIFIALEGMFFTLVFTLALSPYLLITIAIVAIVVTIGFIYFFYKRGKGIDAWGSRLYELFKKEGMKEFEDYYYGCFKRKELIGRKWGWFHIIFGWGEGKWWKRWNWFKSFKSARRAVTTYMPILVIMAWILILIIKIDC